MSCFRILTKLIALALALTWLQAVVAQDALQDKTIPFAPLPAASELKALNESEAEAGVVILSVRREYSGEIWADLDSVRGSETQRAYFRYLVLDAHGVEQVNEHAFFSDELPKDVHIIGRTILPDGKEYTLDPAKDIRDLDFKDAKGRKLNTVRTAFFPHVQPGAILDLSYSFTDAQVPDFTYVPLQYSFPVREQSVQVVGKLFSRSRGQAFWTGGKALKLVWVPFFTGPVPPRAHAKIDADFNLELTTGPILPWHNETASPPKVRLGYGLGLMPRIFPHKEEEERKKWEQDLTLFGPKSPLRKEIAAVAEGQDIDPADATVQFDSLGLQLVPDWTNDEAMMRWWQERLDTINSRLNKFCRRDPRAAKRLIEAAQRVAPPTMPWKERVRKLYALVRESVRPDPMRDDAVKLAHLLEAGTGSERDIGLLFVYLCEKLDIPAHVVIAINRYRVGFMPILESWRVFGASYLIEVGPPGEPSLYLSPGDPFCPMDAVPTAYLGALAFRQPSGEGERWPMFRIPEDPPHVDRTAVELSAALDPEAPNTGFDVVIRQEGSASYGQRWAIGWGRYRSETDKVAKEQKEVNANLLNDFTGFKWEGAVPAGDNRLDVEEPWVTKAKITEPSDYQLIGGRVLARAIVPAYFCNGYLEAKRRTNPLWLPGGHYELGLSWTVPAGLHLEAPPPTVQREGPKGLRFRLEVVSKRSEASATVVHSNLIIDMPYFLPASDYADAKAFFEGLQRASETRLVFVSGAEAKP